MENILQNPFSPAHSSYAKFDGEKLQLEVPENALSAFQKQAHDIFRKFVLHPEFSCIAGQHAIRNNMYGFGAYESMNSFDAAEGVCHDLFRFKEEFDLEEIRRTERIKFLSFIATFKEPELRTELDAAEGLYHLLKNMHEHDVNHGFKWAEGFSTDIDSGNFAYSNGSEAYFVPMSHPLASSDGRRFPYNLVLFNAHVLFENLRKKAAFSGLKEIIRARLTAVHPLLADHGNISELPQYTLLSPELEKKEQEVRERVLGKCPFHSS